MSDEQRIKEAKAHLGAAIRQRSRSDDEIISGHIDEAYRLLWNIGIADRKHVHRTDADNYLDGKLVNDTCADCGHDLRHAIHAHIMTAPKDDGQ